MTWLAKQFGKIFAVSFGCLFAQLYSLRLFAFEIVLFIRMQNQIYGDKLHQIRNKDTQRVSSFNLFETRTTNDKKATFKHACFCPTLLILRAFRSILSSWSLLWPPSTININIRSSINDYHYYYYYHYHYHHYYSTHKCCQYCDGILTTTLSL